MDRYTVVSKLYQYLKSVVPKPLPAPPPPKPTGVICEKCGREMVEKESRFGKFLACPGFPACRNIKPIVKALEVPCPKCRGQIVEKKSKAGKIFYGCANYSANGQGCDYVSWDKPLKENCPKCGQFMVDHIGLNRRHHKFCSNPACENARPLPKPGETTTTEAAKKPAARTARKTSATKKTTSSRSTKKK